MMRLMTVPELIGPVIASATSACLGYLLKTWIEHRRRQRDRRSASRDRLRRLSALLQQSFSVFCDQSLMVRRLSSELADRLPELAPTGRGFDEDFFMAYERLTPSERELHSIIRSTTMRSLRTVNEQLSQWLLEDIEFKTYSGKEPRRVELQTYLRTLERHLSTWHDKYMGVLVNDPKRCLVYLGDEKGHGVAFPSGIETAVASCIARDDS